MSINLTILLKAQLKRLTSYPAIHTISSKERQEFIFIYISILVVTNDVQVTNVLAIIIHDTIVRSPVFHSIYLWIKGRIFGR